MTDKDKDIYYSATIEMIDKDIESLMNEREEIRKELEEIDLEIAACENYKDLLNTRFFNKEDDK